MDHKDLISRCNGVKSLSMFPPCNHQLEHSRHYATSRRRHSSASSNSTRSQELGLIRRRILLIGANAPSHSKEFHPLRSSFSLSLSLSLSLSFVLFLASFYSVFVSLSSLFWLLSPGSGGTRTLSLFRGTKELRKEFPWTSVDYESNCKRYRPRVQLGFFD